VPVVEPSWWRRNAVAVVSGVVSLLVIVGVGWVLLKPDGKPDPVSAAANPTTSGALSPTPSPTPSPTASPTPTPTAAPTTAAPTSHPVPTAPPAAPPPVAERPPAPAPEPTADPGCQPTYVGDAASRAQVRDALVAAGNTQYWVGVQLPKELTGPLPVIKVPANLMKAVAWQESGWQSNIMACDGGIGTMQVMPNTVQQVNDRFGENYDVNTLSGNVKLGANYIEWLIMYFGLFYFGQNFNLDVSAPVGTGGEVLTLLDVVVSAYNNGAARLEQADNTLSITNWSYVNNVEALMTSCECLAF
jgi:hypothetical protein